MTLLPSGVKIHVALGVTDMRKGLDGLAMLVQGTLKQRPVLGSPVRVPRPQGRSVEDPVLGRLGSLPVHQEAGAEPVLLACRGRGHRSVMLTTAQLSMLIEGIDWRSPERRWRPAAAG